MTQIVISKPIVKLPRKRQTILLENGMNGSINGVSDGGGGTATDGYAAAATKQADFSVVVSDKLYIDPLTATATPGITERNILEHLRSCEPIEFNLSTGIIRFSSIERADRAYTLFNDTKIKDAIGNSYKLHLKVHPPFQQHAEDEPEATSDFLQVRNLPLHTTTNHHLYNIFRPFGPMSVCKVIIKNGNFKGTALVQYYRSCDAAAACAEMNNKVIQGNMITISPFLPKKVRFHSGDSEVPYQPPSMTSVSHYHSHSTQYHTPMPSALPVVQDRNNVDYNNLYIKNLDLNVDSPDLYKHFKRCGQIVSARVMRNYQTKQSKGYGFVSFLKGEDAFRALNEMNNTILKSKPIILAFHEPKKPRQSEQQQQQQQQQQQPPPPQYRSHDLIRRYSQPVNIPPHPPPPYMPVAPSNTEYVPYGAPLPPLPISTASHPSSHASSIHSRHQQQQQQPQHRQHHNHNQQQQQQNYYQSNKPPSPPVNHSITKPCRQHNALAPNGYIHPSQPQQRTSPRPTFQWSSSAESVTSSMTEATSNLQKQRLCNAIYRCGEQYQVDDIVDMLLTLKPKERSVCLFNQDFLEEKIRLAKTALEVCKEEEDDTGYVDHREETAKAATTYLPSRSPPPLSRKEHHHHHHRDHQHDQQTKNESVRSSTRTVPIAAPPSQQPSPAHVASLSDASNQAGKEHDEDMDAFLATLEGLTTHEKKQKLGDRLFPRVKATGVRHAPRITIRLLDTVPLYDLAHSMHNLAALKEKVDIVVATMQQQ